MSKADPAIQLNLQSNDWAIEQGESAATRHTNKAETTQGMEGMEWLGTVIALVLCACLIFGSLSALVSR